MISVQAVISAVLAFAPVAMGKIRFADNDNHPRRHRYPSEDVAAGHNPYRVWMEGRNLDVRTVARRMNIEEQHLINTMLIGEGKDLPQIPAAMIVKFCEAVDIRPMDLRADVRVPARPDVVEGAVAYNRMLICGYDKVTQFLKGEAMRATHLAEKGPVNSMDVIRMCEGICVKKGVLPRYNEMTIIGEHERLQTIIYNAAKVVFAAADGKGQLPFSVYAGEGAPNTFHVGKLGMGVSVDDTQENFRREACHAWMIGLYDWFSKPDTRAFLQAEANSRYIVHKNFGIRSAVMAANPMARAV